MPLAPSLTPGLANTVVTTAYARCPSVTRRTASTTADTGMQPGARDHGILRAGRLVLGVPVPIVNENSFLSR